MNTIIKFLLTKTGALRWLAQAAAAALASWGVVKGDDSATVTAAVLAIVTGVVTKFFEAAKDANVKELQTSLGDVKVDGWAGPKTRMSIVRKIHGTNPNPKTH